MRASLRQFGPCHSNQTAQDGSFQHQDPHQDSFPDIHDLAPLSLDFPNCFTEPNLFNQSNCSNQSSDLFQDDEPIPYQYYLSDNGQLNDSNQANIASDNLYQADNFFRLDNSCQSDIFYQSDNSCQTETCQSDEFHLPAELEYFLTCSPVVPQPACYPDQTKPNIVPQTASPVQPLFTLHMPANYPLDNNLTNQTDPPPLLTNKEKCKRYRDNK